MIDCKLQKTCRFTCFFDSTANGKSVSDYAAVFFAGAEWPVCDFSRRQPPTSFCGRDLKQREKGMGKGIMHFFHIRDHGSPGILAGGFQLFEFFSGNL